jgi:hypothetical protein
MADGLTRFLKRWRDNYYLSTLLAPSAKPLRSFSRPIAHQVPRRVRKNGVTIQLPNGRNMTIGRDAGIGMASLLFLARDRWVRTEYFAHPATFVRARGKVH